MKTECYKQEFKPQVKISYAANITYSGSAFNTILNVEYEHTGKQWFYKKKGQRTETFTESPNIANEKAAQGLKVREESGYYFISRISNRGCQK